jgi:hypothetical protein
MRRSLSCEAIFDFLLIITYVVLFVPSYLNTNVPAVLAATGGRGTWIALRRSFVVMRRVYYSLISFRLVICFGHELVMQADTADLAYSNTTFHGSSRNHALSLKSMAGVLLNISQTGSITTSPAGR